MLSTIEKVARWTIGRRGFESRLAATDIGNVHYYDGRNPNGTLPTFAVLHGVGSNAAPYARVLSRLKREARRVVAPETPAHGLSPMPEEGLTPDIVFRGVSGVLDQALDEPAVVFGNSLGGGLALRYAIERPEKVRALILSSPAGAPFSEEELPLFFKNFELKSKAEGRAFLGHLYDRVPWYAPMIVPDLLDNFERPALRQFFAAVSPRDFATGAELSALPMPILFLWGQAETLMPAHHLAFFREHLPSHALIEEPAGWGHSPYLEHPYQLTRRIIDFARTLDS